MQAMGVAEAGMRNGSCFDADSQPPETGSVGCSAQQRRVSLGCLRAGGLLALIDGDVPHGQRERAVASCRLLVSNPDTLHAWLLKEWRRPPLRRLLSGLRLLALDEVHVYR